MALLQFAQTLLEMRENIGRVHDRIENSYKCFGCEHDPVRLVADLAKLIVKIDEDVDAEEPRPRS